MRCAWKELLGVLPAWLRQPVDEICAEQGEEIRLRLGMPPELVCHRKRVWLDRSVTRDDLNQCVNLASRYSPWSSASAGMGYITAAGGHRMGLCGDAVVKEGKVTGFREIRSITLRIARDITGIAPGSSIHGSTVIIGPPGAGKTTMLRDLVRNLSCRGVHIAVVDERCEIFPDVQEMLPGKCTDVMSAAPKEAGIAMVLRTIGPEWIAVDEITQASDCAGLLHGIHCGVKLLATAHAGSMSEFKKRELYRPLVEQRVFTAAIVLGRDKSWTLERMEL